MPPIASSVRSAPRPRNARASRADWWDEPLKRLATEPVVALDLETSGLDWRHNFIAGWVMTFGPDPRDSYYLPVRHVSGNILDYRAPFEEKYWDGKLHPVEKEIVRILNQRDDLYIIGHNLQFDLKFMWRWGMRNLDAQYEDTQVNAALLDEYSGSYSLGQCGHDAGISNKKFLEIYKILHERFPKTPVGQEMGNFWKLPGDMPDAIEYATTDGTATWQLREWQYYELEKQNLQLVHDIECRLLPVLVRMSCRGIRIDERRCRQLIEEIDSGAAWDEAGLPRDFNVKAPSQVKPFLESKGITNWPLTATGKPSFNEQFLMQSEPGQQILRVRKEQTLRNSFLMPMLERHLWNGRVHPNYHQLKGEGVGTITGRLSCSDPNLQQASKRNPLIGRKHRSIFIPDEGKVWASVDYRQCEPVLLAYYSRCKVLLDGFRADPPVDAHSAVTRAVDPTWSRLPDEEFFGKIDKTPEFKAAREIGKRINQTLLTGGGQKVLVTKYGMDMKEVKRVWTEYFRKMPEIRDLQKRAEHMMRHRKYMLSLLGRRARLEKPEWAYVGLNRLLQCGNADIIKLKMVQMDDYLRSEGRPVDLLNNVHDAIDFQFDEDNRHHYERCLEIMTDFHSEDQPIKLDLPLRVDAGEGRNWAEATFDD